MCEVAVLSLTIMVFSILNAFDLVPKQMTNNGLFVMLLICTMWTMRRVNAVETLLKEFKEQRR